ncbi:hypothetical protein SKAU_G00241610 [Synaphobranchus kaupii]|uniref:Uncharacterized protein n=1 Tax=Synaphobranchus kaupii TaxID=118154 RepID=A0A9Q1F7S7_SYNKA|nr:hypothetical protein SKAU_G00241610 [Synaphobranchus kaupii]
MGTEHGLLLCPPLSYPFSVGGLFYPTVERRQRCCPVTEPKSLSSCRGSKTATRKSPLDLISRVLPNFSRNHSAVRQQNQVPGLNQKVSVSTETLRRRGPHARTDHHSPLGDSQPTLAVGVTGECRWGRQTERARGPAPFEAGRGWWRLCFRDALATAAAAVGRALQCSRAAIEAATGVELYGSWGWTVLLGGLSCAFPLSQSLWVTF